MQVASFEDAIAFFDGQVTLSDVNGVGYNLGVGFRWLHWAPFPHRAGADHRLQLLGGRHEHRVGQLLSAGRRELRIARRHVGSARQRLHPHSARSRSSARSPRRATIVFNENFLVLEAIADRNTSFNVAEAEIARRIMPDRDAWAFAGPYVLAN